MREWVGAAVLQRVGGGGRGCFSGSVCVEGESDTEGGSDTLGTKENLAVQEFNFGLLSLPLITPSHTLTSSHAAYDPMPR